MYRGQEDTEWQSNLSQIPSSHWVQLLLGVEKMFGGWKAGVMSKPSIKGIWILPRCTLSTEGEKCGGSVSRPCPWRQGCWACLLAETAAEMHSAFSRGSTICSFSIPLRVNHETARWTHFSLYYKGFHRDILLFSSRLPSALSLCSWDRGFSAELYSTLWRGLVLMCFS